MKRTKTGGHQTPCFDPLVPQLVKGVRCQIGVAPTNRKNGLSTEEITAIVTSLEPGRVIDVRDKAILLLGFATAMRRSELVALYVDDLENHPDGLIVYPCRSKTDQEASGHRIEVACGTTRPHAQFGLPELGSMLV